MKANRRRSKKMSVIATNTARFGVILGVFFLMAIVYILSASSRTQLMNEQGRMRRELEKLEDAHLRESSQWEAMKTPERIEAAIARHGLKMALPRPDQQIHVNAKGVPNPNQLALKRLRQRAATATAQYTTKAVSRPVRRVR